MTAETVPGVQVPWDKLLLWTQRQIALEMQTGQPVALTRPQLQALSQFVSFNEEPDVSDGDYVSLLMQKVQSLRLSNPIFADQEPVNIPVDGHFQPLWRTVCTMERYGTFPCNGFGFSTGQQAPYFQSKKNAKQFAAKQALGYLSSQKTITPANVLGIPRQVISPLQLPKRTTQPPPLQKSPPGKRPCPSPKNEPVPSGISSQESTPGARIPGSPSVFEQISSLTGRLALESPMYSIEPDPQGGNLFCGRPVFKNAARVPSGLGVVSGVEGHMQTKQKVAEAVLGWLQSELQKRQDTFESLWSVASSPKGGTPTS